MEIKQQEENNQGSFFVETEGAKAAEMTYAIRYGDTMVIEHTEVDDSLRGKSVGLRLVNAGVDFARQHGYKIVPQCPFAKAVFDKKPDEYKDVLKQR